MTVSVEEVQLRSYMIWEREGRPMGRDQEHWFRAQAELAEDAGAPEVSTAAPAKRKASAPKGTKAGAAKKAPAAKRAKTTAAKKSPA